MAKSKKVSFSTKNFKEAYSFTPIDLLMLGIGVLWYTALPTLIKQNNWIGFLTAYAPPAVIAGFMKNKILAGATLGVALTHAVRKFGNDWLAGDPDVNEGKGIWELESSPEETKPLSNSAYGELPSGAKLMQIGGDRVIAYDSSTMNDYFAETQELKFPMLNDYIPSTDEVGFKNRISGIRQERF